MPSIDITPPLICNAVVLPPIPPLPTGISISVGLPIPTIPFGVKLCCYSVQFDPTTLIPPVPIISAALAIPIATAVNAFIAQINRYIQSLPVPCPKGDGT